jgi:hypothetical protein
MTALEECKEAFLCWWNRHYSDVTQSLSSRLFILGRENICPGKCPNFWSRIFTRDFFGALKISLVLHTKCPFHPFQTLRGRKFTPNFKLGDKFSRAEFSPNLIFPDRNFTSVV